jgi:hypothetical protein
VVLAVAVIDLTTMAASCKALDLALWESLDLQGDVAGPHPAECLLAWCQKYKHYRQGIKVSRSLSYLTFSAFAVYCN